MDVKSMIKRGLRYIVKGVPVNVVNANICYLSPEKKLEGQKIIVTGGGRGLGFAMAKRFVSEGAIVLIAGRNKEKLCKSADAIGCEWLYLDIQAVDTFDGFISEASKRLGGVDCLVNNAGISLHESTFFDVTAESFDLQFNTNLRGPFFLSQSFVKFIEENKQKANILFVSSDTGDMADIRPYGLSKAAINSFVKGLAYLLAPLNVRVNGIAPGVTASDMTGFSINDNLYYDSPAGRVYLPEEMAEVATFLISDASSIISGQIVTCDNASTINARWK